MEVLATDNFNRADNNSLGANWTVNTAEGAAGFKIASNAATTEVLGADELEYYSAITWPNDQYAQAKVTVTGTSIGTGFGVGLRISSTQRTYYRIIACKHVPEAVDISKFVNGSITLLAQRNVTWVDGDLLKAEIIGSTLRVYQNGAQLGADIIDSSIASGYAGISYSSTVTSGFLEDWEGGGEVYHVDVAWLTA